MFVFFQDSHLIIYSQGGWGGGLVNNDHGFPFFSETLNLLNRPLLTSLQNNRDFEKEPVV